MTAATTQTVLLDQAGSGSPKIDGKSYVLYDAQSDTFLLGKNQDTPLPPASITKVMTILLAFETLQLADTITITPDMYKSIPNDYVRLGLVEGEIITVEQALYGCLLISANDTAMALAITMGGSVDGFAQMMNARATELGCRSTHFTNPYGLTEKEHLTTAHDMALIMAAALKNEAYTKIANTKHYMLPATNINSGARGLTNGNRFISTTKYAYANYIGGKTGYTVQAGYTIAAGARQDNRTLISVILGASCSEIRYANLIALFNYGFAAYRTASIDPAEFKAIKDEAVAQVASQIKDAGHALSVSSAVLNLNPYTTTTSARSTQGYTCSIGVSQSVIQPVLASQVLKFPLYRQYADGTKNMVGALDITVSKTQVAAIASGIAADANANWGSLLLRIIIVAVLAAIVVFCLILIYFMIKRDLKRKRRRKRPRPRQTIR